jgi:hypothetical protein
MPDEQNKSRDEAAPLAVPGVLCVTPTKPGQNVIHLGPAAGWMLPRGLMQWEQELSFVARADMTGELAKALRATLPHEQIAPKRFPMATKAAELSPFLPLANNLVEGARAAGVRVHTVGADRVSGDFYYFAEGGSGPPLQAQGNLIEMVAPTMSASATNADINAVLVNLIDRLLGALSGGVVSELSVELADALPRLSRDGTGLEGTDLEAFEKQSRTLADASARWAGAARQLADALAASTRRGESRAQVPLFGEARQETAPALEVSLKGKPLRLPAWSRWTASGAPRLQVEVTTKAAPSPSAPRVAAADAPRAAAKRSEAAVRKRAQTETEPAAKTAVTEPSAPTPPVAAPAKTGTDGTPPAPTRPQNAPTVREEGQRRGSAKSPSFAMMLLFAFATSMYFLWRSLQ